MKVTILGSGTAFPDLTRNSAGVLLEHEGRRYLIDCGYGTVHQLLRLNITYHDIDGIFFTHHHPDHMCDLIYFLFGSQYPGDPRTNDLPIVAAPGFRAYFDTLMAAFNHWLVPKTYQVNILEQDEETRDHHGLQVTTARVQHIEMSRGYRFEDARGNSVAISGDTDYHPNMAALGRDADLMVLECATPDAMKVAKHSTPAICGRMAREAGCKTLCLTHFYPPCDDAVLLEECRREFDGNIVLAEDLTAFNF
ncbi:MBL fold metallo-hydrolase [Nitrospina watsonii]|uniref:Ribonuclease Z n=1 Tax=Nitrospina watsonii TaxID=1323948 RepID=A0ABM9HFJ8_9BACT|nr:MBL fold metallo-hydrolase [Nitrospina watsonii]CAI2719002.1 Ribonuclease Z [Nitrospina watsonii]